MTTLARFINEHIYLIFRSAVSEDGRKCLLFCSGVNTTRFRPLTRGKHGNASNPSFRGLQLLRLRTVVPKVLELGGKVELICGDHCEPAPIGDGWFSESMELHGVPESLAAQMLPECVGSLVGVILKVCFPGMELPANVGEYEPGQLDAYLDSLA